MTKELFILFVYDTQLCQREEDDPQDAVLYFYPNWVTDQQRLALCGQLMGATQFYLTAFSCPRILSLSSGKFAIQQYGRYIIAIGTDRNVPDWIIDHRATTLQGLLQLYHCSLDTIANNVVSLETSLREKLGQIFETFLPILQYAVDVFGTIPTIRLPKSASNVFLEAIQILHSCQSKKGVLGGVVLYQNRVVASQLSASLTKNLVCTDPYRIKTPADSVITSFHLPIGVQLIKVFIEHSEFYKLSQEAESSRVSFESVAKHKQAQYRVQTILGKPPPFPKEQLSILKRDISRIFTVHEEEGETDAHEEIKILSVNGVTSNGIAEDTTHRSPCTTPMRDVNLSKVLHDHVVSICRVSECEENDCANKTNTDGTQKGAVHREIKNIIEKELSMKPGNRNETPNYFIKHRNDNIRSWQSLTDMPSSVGITTNRIPLRAYSFGLPRLTHGLLDQDSSDTRSEHSSSGKQRFNTIADPCYPVLRSDGLSISHCLFDEYLTQHYKMLNKEESSTTNSGKITLTLSSQSAINDDTQNFTRKDNKNPKSFPIKDSEKRHAADTNISSKQVSRHSLSLPLKNTTSDSTSDSTTLEETRKQLAFPPGALESPSVRTRMMGSIPLTPLMSKLTSLALEEKSSGFYSRDTTPSEFRDLGSLLDKNVANSIGTTSNFRMSSEKQENLVSSKAGKLPEKPPEGAVLYVFGQQSMALMLLLEEKYSFNPELINSLWETCVGSVNCLEAHLRQCLEHVGQGSETESYSYICLDPQWDMLQRGGPWGCLELDMVTSLHDDFKQSNSLTEIVVRCEDSTVYGYQCGKTEVFYHQSSSATVGLPTPSDLMGVVPLKARRRLERDHGIVLL